MLKDLRCMEGTLVEGSVGAHVPTVLGSKQNSQSSCEEIFEAPPAKVEVDKDFLCPICMQTMKDAFLTACGHSFCYMCIMTHLNNKKNCPCCGFYLTLNQLYPNFLLNKILKKVFARQLVSNASPAEHLRLALKQGVEIPVKELDSLLIVLAERKRKAEQEEAEANLEILLEFLHKSRQQKQEELNEIQGDLLCLQEDIRAVEQRRHELMKLTEHYSSKLFTLPVQKPGDLGQDTAGYSVSFGGQSQTSAQGCLKSRKGANSKYLGRTLRRDEHFDIHTDEYSELPSSAVSSTKKRRVLAQFEDLQDCYLQKRRKQLKTQSESFQVKVEQGSCDSSDSRGLEDFEAVLAAFTRYRCRLQVIAELRYGDLFHSSNIVSSIEFDRDDEFFATAGVSRRIKVFEFAAVVNELADVHCPVVEMMTRSKLSCLSWNKYIKGQLASSDYEGIVTVWDVNTRQSVMEYEEHEKRAWSVDFARTEPSLLVSGSDDGKVKIWSTKQETSALTIDIKANICCVKYNPGSSNLVAVGSADHHIHYYDLRNSHLPVHIFSGHRKAVSYVKFISSNELASASTDSTLRLWDVQKNSHVRTMKGHTNEKNFVGLTVNSEYIACGSETNEIFVYHKAMSKPAAWHGFGSPDFDDSDDDTSQFISAVCWKSESPTMLAANSQGTIKVLVLAP
ncbi:hypothetical protein O6H91_05G021900 [Diphasiastrum complanatum]|uniref:Uncharacterized protein n=1 Tax=Diphasiastrum complanatum TaxID=34168 RepID=A0ACC2DL79_DIPCM|nr:hypothetical protein O6H91_05G021900 [Diphasiastrum complanatum]